jgi:hypothetical protein
MAAARRVVHQAMAQGYANLKNDSLIRKERVVIEAIHRLFHFRLYVSFQVLFGYSMCWDGFNALTREVYCKYLRKSLSEF